MHMALAEDDSTLYMVALQAPKNNSDAYHASVLLPVIQSLEPMPLDRRDRLTYSQSMAADSVEDGPVYNAYFEPLEEPSAALHELEGILTVPEFEMHFKNPDNEFARSSTPTSQDSPSHSSPTRITSCRRSERSCPRPVSRALLEHHPLTGESLVGSWRRRHVSGFVSFVLVGPDYNEAHNGVSIFLYDDTRISSIHFQVIQETAAWNQTDFLGAVAHGL